MSVGVREMLPAILAKAEGQAASLRAGLAPRADGWRMHETTATAARDVLVKVADLRDFITKVDARPEWHDDEYHDELVAHTDAVKASLAELKRVADAVNGER